MEWSFTVHNSLVTCKIRASWSYIIGLWILKWKKLYVFKWIFNSLESCLAPLILTLVRYFLFCMNYIRRKKPELWWKQSSPIFPVYMRKVGPRAQPGPRCRPSGQPGGQANWPAKELACLARGKALPQRGNLKRELRSCWDSGERGSKQQRWASAI